MFLLRSVLLWLAQLAAYPLVPLAVAMADEEGRLPSGLRWLETPDALGWGAGTYEPEIRDVYDRRGKRAALRAWLLRNKAYGLCERWRARIDRSRMVLSERGPRVPPRWGFWRWRGDVDEYFDGQYGLSLGSFYVYLRCGWKLKPLFVDQGDRNKVIGFFQGITPRSDDWDDFAAS